MTAHIINLAERRQQRDKARHIIGVTAAALHAEEQAEALLRMNVETTKLQEGQAIWESARLRAALAYHLRAPDNDNVKG